MRRLMLEAIETVQRGERPRGLDPETHRTVRAHDNFIKEGEDWRQVFGSEIVAKW